MRRDVDLVRELLLKVEALPMRMGGFAHVVVSDPETAIEGRSEDEIHYQLELLF